MCAAFRLCIALAFAFLAMTAHGEPSCVFSTPAGTVDLTQLVPSAWLTEVKYPLGIDLRWWIGVSPCHLQNATLPPGKTCAPGYAFAVSPLKFLTTCSETFPVVLERSWLPATSSARVVVQNPADGRIVNTTVTCDPASTKNITLTAPIHTPDAHHYYVTGTSSSVCPVA